MRGRSACKAVRDRTERLSISLEKGHRRVAAGGGGGGGHGAMEHAHS